jgi:hypothetical protein
MEQLAEQPAHTTDLPFSNTGMKRTRPSESDHLSQQVRWGDNAQAAPDTKRGRSSSKLFINIIFTIQHIYISD